MRRDFILSKYPAGDADEIAHGISRRDPMTFSLIARCDRTGQFGMVIASSSPAVAARCAHPRAGVGAAASQNVTDPALGPLVLDRMAAGRAAAAALAEVTGGALYRLSPGDGGGCGGAAAHSVARAVRVWGRGLGRRPVAAGNLLAFRRGCRRRWLRAFGAGRVPWRPACCGLLAGRDAGGEAGPVHSAGI